MTKEEAIYRLKNMAWLYGSAEREQNIEAIEMAIEALKREEAEANGYCHRIKPKEYFKNDAIKPSNDVINRADAIETIMSEPMNEPKYPIWFADKLKELPSADAKSVRSKCEVEIKKVELKDGFKIDDVPQDWKPKVIGNVEVVVRCKDCRYQEHCHETVAHTKDHDGFREHWSEPIEWCSRGERREE